MIGQSAPAPVIGQSAPAPTGAGRAAPVPAPRKAPTVGGVAVGRIVEADVVTVGPKDVEVRLIDGRPGVIPASEFPEPPRPGDRIDGALLAREDPRQRVVLSHSWALKQRAWQRIEVAKETHTPVTGVVRKQVKGAWSSTWACVGSCPCRSSPTPPEPTRPN